MTNKPLREKPLEIKKIIYFSSIILGLEFINFLWQRGYYHLYSVVVFLVMTGLLGFLMWGIWHGKNWSRLIWIIISLVGIPITLYSLSTRWMPEEVRVFYSIQFVLSLMVLYYLMKKETANWFKRSKRGPSVKKVNGAVTKRSPVPIHQRIWSFPYLDMEFVFVGSGRFETGEIFDSEYGDKKPVFEVYVDSFWISKFPITQGQWKRLMDHNPSAFQKGDDYPVEHVNWSEVQEFILRLNQKTGIRFRLPTEEEWEFAARSGGKNEKWAGTDNESELPEFAWYSMNSNGGTHPVGQKKANGMGLYDMSGNVWEWVQDYYGKTEQRKAIRGGSWNDPPALLKTAARACIVPKDRIGFFGFRLILPINP